MKSHAAIALRCASARREAGGDASATGSPGRCGGGCKDLRIPTMTSYFTQTGSRPADILGPCERNVPGPGMTHGQEALYSAQAAHPAARDRGSKCKSRG